MPHSAMWAIETDSLQTLTIIQTDHSTTRSPKSQRWRRLRRARTGSMSKSDAEIYCAAVSSNHPIARGDMSRRIQMGWINDSATNRRKFFRRAQMVCGAGSVASNPFSPQCDETNNHPHRIKTRCGIRLQRQRINHQKNSRHNIHALIQQRIALRLFRRDQRICQQI